MPDLAPLLPRTAVGASPPVEVRCSRCRRTPLVGERVHVFESERTLCDLCLTRLPERERTPDRTELVHATQRPLAIAPAA